MKKLFCMVAAIFFAATMVADGAPSYSEAEATQSVVVEAKAQELVVQVYGALKSNNSEAFKKAETQINDYVATLSKDDQTKFFQAFEKAYGELISTGKITKVEPKAAAESEKSAIDSAVQMLENAVEATTEKAKEWASQATAVVEDVAATATSAAKEAAKEALTAAESAVAAAVAALESFGV